MSEDLIEDDFIDKINMPLIKRNIILIKALLFFGLIYTIVMCVDWYLIFSSIPYQSLNPSLVLFYKIYPFLMSLLIIAGLYGMFLTLKANQLILNAFENADATQFNAGFLFFSKATLYSIATTSVSIVLLVLRFFLKY
jgi:hypothetical protein